MKKRKRTCDEIMLGVSGLCVCVSVGGWMHDLPGNDRVVLWDGMPSPDECECPDVRAINPNGSDVN